MPKKACGEYVFEARHRQMDTLAAFGCNPAAQLVLPSFPRLPRRSSASGKPIRAGHPSTLVAPAGGCCAKVNAESIRSVRRQSAASVASCAGKSCCTGSQVSVDSCAGKLCYAEPKSSTDSCEGKSCCARPQSPVDSCAGKSCCGEAPAAASAASDAVLIRPLLEGIKSLIELSDAVYRRIVLNFVRAFVYNTVAILFAAGAFVNARITPAYAGLGELVSVLPVVLIAMQLRMFKKLAF
ncbi:hypothetical protein BDY19DRAFT_503173 [Irpex rosettiformis]|uniref:Uncharacterized protein n=1 Tax=Irpex rosettiformis TaxID=378272 RepID=A0ACB8UEZ7_9APHY|nr:hypothetical protein BDY19DRAFT_503173 [Irpex rosettiformis]